MRRFSQPLRGFARSVRSWVGSALGRGYVRAARRSGDQLGLSPESMVLAYLQGLFPLGRPYGRVDWETLERRAVIGVGDLHVSKRLRTYLRKDAFEVRFNERFDEVLAGCADRPETWINGPLTEVYRRLHTQDVAHSVEAYRDGELVGVFFLESMYCSVDHASKVAFVKLAERLTQSGFGWIDCQYLSEHWKRFGAKPMPRAELVRHTLHGLECGARFSPAGYPQPIGRSMAEEPRLANAP